MQKEPVVLATFLVSVLVERCTVTAEVPVFVTPICCVVVAPGFCVMLIWFGEISREPGVALVRPIEVASLTAARMLSKPAPCCSAGASMSVAVLIRICLTSAGVG